MVPEAVERGTKVEARYLEQEVLYSVNWYRGDREFCRYAPRDVPPVKIFRKPGIEVNAATQTAGGRYTCEVSADAPSFQTAQVHTHMYVVMLPKSGPSMHGLKRRYRPGMKLKVECISRHSLPAANLSFFINNDAILCTASIYSIYLQSLEKSAEEERIRTTPVSLPEVHEAVVYSIHRLPESTCLDTGKIKKDYGAQAAGWGRLGHNKGLADTLQVVYLNEFNESECATMYIPHRHLTDGYNHTSQICYGSDSQIIDTCEGDSGGPLQVNENECLYTIVGLTSFGKNCGVLGSAGMYTRVEHFRPWIESYVWPGESAEIIHDN